MGADAFSAVSVEEPTVGAAVWRPPGDVAPAALEAHRHAYDPRAWCVWTGVMAALAVVAWLGFGAALVKLLGGA